VRTRRLSAVFSRTVRSLEDLKTGMELTRSVRNIVDFGAFVDIDVKQGGFVHISNILKTEFVGTRS